MTLHQGREAQVNALIGEAVMGTGAPGQMLEVHVVASVDTVAPGPMLEADTVAPGPMLEVGTVAPGPALEADAASAGA